MMLKPKMTDEKYSGIERSISEIGAVIKKNGLSFIDTLTVITYLFSTLCASADEGNGSVLFDSAVAAMTENYKIANGEKTDGHVHSQVH